MSQVQTVLSALPRIQLACRAPAFADPETGRKLSEHQARILSHLDGEDPTMVTELAEHMGVTASTMSLNLKRLRDAGFVRSERDPQDRRVMNVRLTEAGERVRRGFRELDPVLVDSMLRLLRPGQRRAAVHALAVLADAADAMVARTSDYVASLTEGV